MKRKTILTSAILALLAVGQGHADNSFVVKDSNTGKKQLEEAEHSESYLLQGRQDGSKVRRQNHTRTCVHQLYRAVLRRRTDERDAGRRRSRRLASDVSGWLCIGYRLTSPAHAAIYNISGQRAMSLKAWDGTRSAPMRSAVVCIF